MAKKLTPEERSARISAGLRAWHASRPESDAQRTQARRKHTWRKKRKKFNGKFSSYEAIEDSVEEL